MSGPQARSIPDPGFPDDAGEVDPHLRAALDVYAQAPDAPGAAYDVIAVLQDTRLLVPVVALLGEVEVGAHGLAQEKTADMAAVLMQGRDGRQALLSFTGLEPLQTWNPEARPVPVSAMDAARSARQDGAAALLVDVAGPVLFVVEGEDLQALADGWRLTRLEGRWAWVAATDSPGTASPR
ncbi:SseB family protein [Nocardioides massiliensis]|uniref:SseB protein N-terminal domain-containing protein n=1 Tax=Nocardioides massiliensis TaxID=1325935 RepID=A0ABT9NS60_9ACTN|nr:SseB family protein [Nocardioides massiliensis]MDP9822885.1 hypothetical protein [Nocardioides massiliensis]